MGAPQDLENDREVWNLKITFDSKAYSVGFDDLFKSNTIEMLACLGRSVDLKVMGNYQRIKTSLPISFLYDEDWDHYTSKAARSDPDLNPKNKVSYLSPY